MTRFSRIPQLFRTTAMIASIAIASTTAIMVPAQALANEPPTAATPSGSSSDALCVSKTVEQPGSVLADAPGAPMTETKDAVPAEQSGLVLADEKGASTTETTDTVPATPSAGRSGSKVSETDKAPISGIVCSESDGVPIAITGTATCDDRHEASGTPAATSKETDAATLLCQVHTTDFATPTPAE